MACTLKSIRWLSDITGQGVTSQWDVTGTDLGIPVYSPKQKRMYFLFGDTFGQKKTEDGSLVDTNWRGTVAGYTDRFDFSQTILWDGFLSESRGFARELIPAHYTEDKARLERTKISQGGIEIDGNLYIFYESINHWGPEASGYWYLNYGGTLKSTDGGQTFTKVYDLSWVEPTDEEGLATAKSLVEEDMTLQPSGTDFDVKAHIAPGFGQMYAADGKDGYIYVYGRRGGRISGIKVGRALKAEFEHFDAFEYLTRFENGNAVWQKGRAGLDAIMADEATAEIVPGPTSNMSVAYNAYLGKWMLIYYLPGEGIYYRLSDTPYGPFDEAKLLLSIDHPDVVENLPPNANRNRLYGAFMHEAMNQEQGRIVPFIISQWYAWPGKPRYYGSRLFVAEFE